MITLAVIWAVLATGVAALIVVRKLAARNEDDYIHVNEAAVTERQTVLAHTLEVIDKWGVTLTVIVIVYGLGLLGLFMYNSWEAGNKLSVQ